MTRFHSSFLLVALAIVGCTTARDINLPVGDTSAFDSNETDDSTDTGETDDFSCIVDPNLFQNVEFTLSKVIPTVARLDWTSDGERTDYVRFGLPGSAWITTLEETATDHQAFLLGLKQSTQYSYSIVSDTSDGVFCSTPQIFTTGVLLGGTTLPDLVVSINEAHAWDGYLLFSLRDGMNDTLIIVDPDGDIVWAYVTNSNVVHRVRFSIDGRAIVYNNLVLSGGDGPSINRISLDGMETTEIPVAHMHTDFVEIANGTYATLGYDIDKYDTDSGARYICGNSILEIASDGTPTEIWNTFQSFQPNLNETYSTGDCAEDVMAEDWTHSNSISYDASDDAYYITIRYLNKACKIDRASKTLLWCVGGEDSEFASIGETQILDNPHSVLPFNGGIYVFENNDELFDGCAAGTIISLDFTSWTAQETWTYGTGTCVDNPLFGNLDPLTNGNLLLALGAAGQIDVTTLEGKTVWRLNTIIGYNFAFVNQYDRLYRSSL